MKQSKKLSVAWIVLAIAVATFILLTKIYDHFQKEHSSNYQYRILISKDIAETSATSEEKNHQNADIPYSEKKDEHNNEKLIKKIEEKFYESSKFGLIPKISCDGKSILDVYSADIQKSKNTSLKKVYLILWVDDVNAATREKILGIIGKLDKEKITFILPHYLVQIAEIVKIIIENGHEFFVQIPTQSSIQPEKKSEVSPFLANSGTDDTFDRLMYLLASSRYAIGVANTTPTLLTKSKKDMSVITEELSKRGLSFIDLEKSNNLMIELSEKVRMPYINVSEILEIKNKEIKNRTPAGEIFEHEFSKFSDGEIVAVRINNMERFLDELRGQNARILPVSVILKNQR